MMTPGSNTSHRVIGTERGQHTRIVKDDHEAWHSEELNQSYLSIEFAQPTISDPFSRWQYEEGARVVRGWAEKYGFALDRETILGHSETAQGQRWGKTDPNRADGTGMFDWDRFIKLARG